MTYLLTKHFSSISSIKWRTRQVCKDKSEAQIEEASCKLAEAIDERKAAQHAEEVESFVWKEAIRISEHGGRALSYLPDSWKDATGTYHFSAQEAYDFLIIESSSSDGKPFALPDEMDDFSALQEYLKSPNRSLKEIGFPDYSDSQLFGLLAHFKASKAESILKITPSKNDRSTKDFDNFPWKIETVISAHALLIQGMELTGFAERSYSNAEYEALRARHQKEQASAANKKSHQDISRKGGNNRWKHTEADRALIRKNWEAWKSDSEDHRSQKSFAIETAAQCKFLKRETIEEYCREWKKERGA